MNSDRIFKIILGVLFIVFGFNLILGTNNTKDTNNSTYAEMEQVMVDSVDNARMGSVIAVKGKVETVDSAATDELTGLVVNTPYLKRTVEMYQWVRDCGESGHDCHYQKEWSDEHYDSSSYDADHQNPEWTYDKQFLFARKAKIDNNQLNSPSILRELPTEEIAEDLRDGTVVAENEWQFKDGYYYKNVDEKEIGDLRIKYERYNGKVVSILAMLSDSGLVPYKGSNGSEAFVVHEGEYDAKALLQMAHNKNALSNIVMIILSLGLIGVGVAFVFSSIKAQKN